jgi:hypothetical protein
MQMSKLFQVYSVVVSLGVIIAMFTFNKKTSQSLSAETETAAQVESEEENTTALAGTLPQVITGMDLTRQYDFAGEVVPAENFDAIERLDRELSVNSYLHANTLINVKSSNRYFPVIEPILAAHGVPDDFKYLAVAESNLRNETSPAGAKGIWQFLKNTGEYYGLEINSEVDERLHLEKSTEAACKYLKDYYKQFGSWTLAAAAYNMGGPRTKKYLEEQRASNYYDLNLNSETSRYVFRLIAIKEIMREPVKFGFYVNDGELYQPLSYRPVSVDGPVASWADFAIEHGTTYRMLKVFNPWLITSSLTNRGKKMYEIKIPE